MGSSPVDWCLANENVDVTFEATRRGTSMAYFPQAVFDDEHRTKINCTDQQAVQSVLCVPVAWVNAQQGCETSDSIMYPPQSCATQVSSQVCQGGIGSIMYPRSLCQSFANHGSSPTCSSYNFIGCQWTPIVPMPIHLDNLQPNYEKNSWIGERAEEERDSAGQSLTGAVDNDVGTSGNANSSRADVTLSRSSRRRKRRAARTRTTQEVASSIPVLDPAPLDELFVTKHMKETMIEHLEAGGNKRCMTLMQICGFVLRMSFEPYGCLVVQFAFGVATGSEKQAMAAELHGHVRDAMSSPHANFVIQKMIQDLPITAADFVAQELLTFGAEAARHRFGCRILSRLVEHHLCNTSGRATTNHLIDELLLDVESLVQHSFARHVIILILEHGSTRQKQHIARTIRNDCFGFAKCRYASYVVEAILHGCCIPERDALACDLVSDIENFWGLVNHECGSHVIKALLKSHVGSADTRARQLLNANTSNMYLSKHGKRLLDEIS